MVKYLGAHLRYQVWEFLKKKGFTKIKLTEINFKNQIGLFNSANTIIGAHGAGLSNMIFSNPNTNIIELQPKNFLNEFFTRVSKINNLIPFNITASFYNTGNSR